MTRGLSPPGYPHFTQRDSCCVCITGLGERCKLAFWLRLISKAMRTKTELMFYKYLRLSIIYVQLNL